MQSLLSQVADISKDFIPIGTPVALAILAVKQQIIFKELTEIKDLLFKHIIPDNKEK